MALSDGIESSRAIGAGWRGVRDSLLSSRRFQRFAAAFPLTRPIARRRAAALFDLCAGFAYSQVLQACVQLRLFDALLDGPDHLGIPLRVLINRLDQRQALRQRGGDTL